MLKKKKKVGGDRLWNITWYFTPTTPPTGTVYLIYKKEGNGSLIAESDFSKQKKKKNDIIFFSPTFNKKKFIFFLFEQKQKHFSGNLMKDETTVIIAIFRSGYENFDQQGTWRKIHNNGGVRGRGCWGKEEKCHWVSEYIHAHTLLEKFFFCDSFLHQPVPIIKQTLDWHNFLLAKHKSRSTQPQLHKEIATKILPFIG